MATTTSAIAATPIHRGRGGRIENRRYSNHQGPEGLWLTTVETLFSLRLRGSFQCSPAHPLPDHHVQRYRIRDIKPRNTSLRWCLGSRGRHKPFSASEKYLPSCK